MAILKNKQHMAVLVALLCAISVCCAAVNDANSPPPIADSFKHAETKNITKTGWVTDAVNAARIHQRIFESAALGGKVSYHIYLPEAYNTQPERRFPVLYWLHGSGGGIAGIRPTAMRFDAAIISGRIPPMLVVFPNGLPRGMWCNWKDGSTPVETFFIEELIPEIDVSFRTQASREGRIIEGFSMGGYGAARLGFKYPELFCAVSILGGGPLQPDFSETPRVGPRDREKVFQAVYGGDMEYYKEQSPWRIAEQNAEAIRDSMTVRIAIGGKDETLKNNRKFHEHLKQLKILHTYMELQGIGHNPNAVMKALDESNIDFYRDVLDSPNENK